jgi:flagellar hook-associated protein 1 FlgK
MVLNTAKGALLTTQYAIDVVSHNIANVNTDGYSRQSTVIKAASPVPYGGFIFGSGVSLQEIQRQVDAFVETRLREEISDEAALTEKETYMTVLEAVFDETSGGSLSDQFNAFWNAWSDLSNNPSGSAERAVLVESGTLLTQTFNDIQTNLMQFDQELNLSLSAGVDEINQLTSQIATLNEQIISAEVNGNANDLRDQRDQLIRDLSEYIDIDVFEDSQGLFTVTTGRGYTLVSKTNAYELSFESDEVIWESSSGRVTITDSVTKGKMGGWLEVRDKIIPKYENELDELAHAVVWEVNKVHSQGVGLEGMSSVTGTFSATDPTEELASADSGLDFWDGIQAGDVTIYVYDSSGNLDNSFTLSIDSNTKLNDAGDTANSLVHMINTNLSNITATESDGQLEITGDAGGYTFAFSDDTSGVLAALGVNTFFNGSDALEIEMNEALANDNDLIAAGQIDASGDYASGDNSNALAMFDLKDTDVTMDRYNYEGTTTTSKDTLQGYYTYLVGSVGIKSKSIQSEQEYAEVVVNQLTELRDNMSAVSTDEEMINLIKFQQAYAAAAKLVSTADEMLQTLLATR